MDASGDEGRGNPGGARHSSAHKTVQHFVKDVEDRFEEDWRKLKRLREENQKVQTCFAGTIAASVIWYAER